MNGFVMKRLLAALFLVVLVVGSIGCDRGLSVDDIRRLQRQGRFEETLDPLREMLAARPDDPQVNYLYGVALVQTGDARLAVWALRKAAEDPDYKLAASVELSAAALHAGNFEEAISVASRVLEENPDHLVARFVRGEAYMTEGKRPELALEDFESVLDLEPDHAPALTARATALLMAGRVEEAAEAIAGLNEKAEELSADEATRARLCATRAVLATERGRNEEALAGFEECLERYPGFAIVIEPAVSFFDQRGNRARATAILTEALELSPGSQRFRSALASRASARGDLDEAEAILKAGTELESAQVRAAAWTALTNHYLLERHDVSSAVEAYEQAMAVSEDPPPLAVLSYADLLARDGQHERALEVASQLENEDYRGLIEARVHLNEGRPAEALARLDEVLPSWPNNAGARYYAARAAEQLGDFSRAVEEYRQSIRSAPEQTESALRLAKLYLAAGARRNAWSSAGQYYRAHPTDPESVRVILQTASTADNEALRELFFRLRGTPQWPVAVAARADTVAEAQGPEAALKVLADTEDIDYTASLNSELLRSHVVHLLAAGRKDEARQMVEGALEAGPENAHFHEILGLVLEAEGAPVESIRAAYERAIDIYPQHVRALESLGRLAEAQGAVDEALASYDRATEAYEEWSDAAHRAAALALREGRSEEAERRYMVLLRQHPWDAEGSMALTELRLARGVADDTTLQLAERAVLFGGGEEAQQLLVRVHEARGESERAAQVAKAAEAGERVAPQQITPFEMD
jgi:tetratricopeptide (TPR) repeat protein